MWLKCERDDQDCKQVALLLRLVCRQYKSNISSVKNYSHRWIAGSANQCTTNVLDHTASDQHKTTMSYSTSVLPRRRKVTSPTQIILWLHEVCRQFKCQSWCKLNLCCIMVKEDIAFKKYPALCKLDSYGLLALHRWIVVNEHPKRLIECSFLGTMMLWLHVNLVRHLHKNTA